MLKSLGFTEKGGRKRARSAKRGVSLVQKNYLYTSKEEKKKKIENCQRMHHEEGVLYARKNPSRSERSRYWVGGGEKKYVAPKKVNMGKRKKGIHRTIWGGKRFIHS